MVLQKILRDPILFAQPFLCSFRKWVLFYTLSAITLYSVFGRRTELCLSSYFSGFSLELKGDLGKFDCNWHSKCPIRSQSCQNKTLLSWERRSAKCQFTKNTGNYVVSLLLPLHVLYDSLEKTEFQESLQSVMERINDRKGRKERLQLLQRVTRCRSQNEKQKYKPRPVSQPRTGSSSQATAVAIRLELSWLIQLRSLCTLQCCLASWKEGRHGGSFGLRSFTYSHASVAQPSGWE